jgi:hypothetical protein
VELAGSVIDRVFDGLQIDAIFTVKRKIESYKGKKALCPHLFPIPFKRCKTLPPRPLCVRTGKP